MALANNLCARFALVLTTFMLIRDAQATPPSVLSYAEAFRYVAGGASKVNASTSDLVRNPHDFYGTMRSLDLFYSDEDHILHVWLFVSIGAGPLLAERAEMKNMLDQAAKQNPEETDHGVFDIRTLSWNQQVSTKLEPCLWLRLDILDNTLPAQEMTKKLDHFSTTGYIWNRQKLPEIQRAYWKAHPKSTEKESVPH